MVTGTEHDSERSHWRRYAVPVLLGVVLGLGGLYLLSRFVQPVPKLDEPRGPSDGSSALLGDNPGVIVTVPEPRPEGAGEPGESESADRLQPCPDGKESIECLLATLDSKWRVVVATDSPVDDGPPTVQAPVGGRLRWPVVSERPGLVTSFVVEADGAVLLIYPSPAGDSPVAQPGVQFDVPRRIDTTGMKWNRPGLRRVFVLVSNVPFLAPEGIAAGRAATYYGAGAPAASFFRAVRSQVHADQVSGDGEWAVGEVLFEVQQGG